MKWIGIHQDYYGKFWVETAETKTSAEAYELIERNDTNLMLFSLKETKKLIESLKTVVKKNAW